MKVKVMEFSNAPVLRLHDRFSASDDYPTFCYAKVGDRDGEIVYTGYCVYYVGVNPQQRWWENE